MKKMKRHDTTPQEVYKIFVCLKVTEAKCTRNVPKNENKILNNILIF